MQLIKELKRRNVFRMAIGYVISTWLLAQVADLVLEAIGAPAWVMQTLLLLFALGFPVVVFFSWAYEVTPEGIKRESEVDHDESITPVTARKLDRAIIAMLVVALGYFVWESRFASDEPHTQSIVEQEAIANAEGDASEEAAAQAGNSIAVLPFVNMSSDEEQEYFSDGLSEELLNLLARNPSLRVAARTSSFSFKGQNLEIQDIAERLQVAYVLEGSVRKAGNQVRITAQLIQASDGYHLWSETYDRNLDNIFVIQDEIASKITTAMLPRIVGGATGQETPAQTGYAFKPPADVYQEYLLARKQYNQQNSSSREQAMEIMTRLVRAYPDYAEAQSFYALLAFESSARTGGDIPWVTAEAMSRQAIDKALALDPANAEAYLVKGQLSARSRNAPEAIPAFEKAIELNPSYSEAYVLLAEALMATGEQERAWAALEAARELDPVSPSMLATVAHLATLHERPETAQGAMSLLRQIAPEWASGLQAHLYVDQAEQARAVIALEQERAQFPDDGPSDYQMATAYSKLGYLEKALEIGAGKRPEMIWAALEGDAERALELADKEAAEESDPHDRADPYWMTYFYLGMYDEALATLSDLWYGYAEQQMGPRMDTFDCIIFAKLLVRAGRMEEARPVMEQLQREAQNADHWYIRDGINADLAEMQGDIDGAMQILHSLADRNWFSMRFGHPYPNYFGLEQHPDYPALIAKLEAWQQEQRELYDSLKAEQAGS